MPLHRPPVVSMSFLRYLKGLANFHDVRQIEPAGGVRSAAGRGRRYCSNTSKARCASTSSGWLLLVEALGALMIAAGVAVVVIGLLCHMLAALRTIGTAYDLLFMD